MLRLAIPLLALLWNDVVSGQGDSGVQMIVTLSGKDTLVIKRFDANQNLVFHKIFPQFGVGQILAWEYVGKTLKSYTWSHSNIGFDVSEYERDSSNLTVRVYSYDLSGQTPPKNLMSYNSLQALRHSDEYQTYVRNGQRFLRSTQFFEHGHLVKELDFESPDRVDTIQYSYSGDLLTKRKEVYGHNGAYNELIYSYDGKGNEVSWMKVFDGSDTSAHYLKTYKEGLLQEVVALEGGRLHSTERYEYSEGRLMFMRKTDDKGIEKTTREYSYEKGKVRYIDEVNMYLGQATRTYYFY